MGKLLGAQGPSKDDAREQEAGDGWLRDVLQDRQIPAHREPSRRVPRDRDPAKDFDKSDDMFNRVFQRDDIAVVTLLEERATGARLIVANLHIYWDPDFRDVKLVQVGILMEELQRIADQFARLPPRKAADGTKLTTYSEGTKIPLIVCGDFNSVPDSGVYQYMNEGFVPPDHPDFMGKNYGEFTSRGMGTSSTSRAPTRLLESFR
jgi:mRNA deadenylase 3'-5' endonuclease subunit Ccr4